LSLFIATTIPVPGLVGAKVFPSIHPLKTHPNPPSPSTLSGRKFFVAILRSLKLKDLRLLEIDTSPLDVIEDGFKLPKVVCLLEVEESCFALQSGFVLPEGRKKINVKARKNEKLPSNIIRKTQKLALQVKKALS
jgi:hypothetical protein